MEGFLRRVLYSLGLYMIAYIRASQCQDVEGSGEVDIPVVTNRVAVASRNDDNVGAMSVSPYWIRSFWAEAGRCQASALVDLLIHYNWTYVNVITSDEPFMSINNQQFQEALRSITGREICIESVTRIPKDATDIVFKEAVMSTLEQYKRARVVVLFLTKEHLIKWMQSVASHVPGRKDWTWVATDEWGDMTWSSETEKVATGALTLQLNTEYTRTKYQDLIGYLSLGKASRKIWYQSMWESTHGCQFNGTGCSGKADTVPLPDVHTSDWRFAEAYLYQALDAEIDKLCEEEEEPNRENCLLSLDSKPIKGSHFYNHNIRDKINSETGCGLSTLEGRTKDGILGYYNVLNYRGEGQGRNGYITIGNWANGLELTGEAQFNGSNKVPKSQCSAPCRDDEDTVHVSEGSCCWVCIAKGHGGQTKRPLADRNSFFNVVKVIWMWLLAVVLAFVLVLIVLGLKCWSLIEMSADEKHKATSV